MLVSKSPPYWLYAYLCARKRLNPNFFKLMFICWSLVVYSANVFWMALPIPLCTISLLLSILLWGILFPNAVVGFFGIFLVSLDWKKQAFEWHRHAFWIFFGPGTFCSTLMMWILHFLVLLEEFSEISLAGVSAFLYLCVFISSTKFVVSNKWSIYQLANAFVLLVSHLKWHLSFSFYSFNQSLIRKFLLDISLPFEITFEFCLFQLLQPILRSIVIHHNH